MTVILALAISLAYTFLRPAVYESSATLLVAPPVIDERAGEVSNAQHVRLELQFLTGHGLLADVLEKLTGDALPAGEGSLTLPEIQEMLVAVSIENTNLIELTARGPDRRLLPALINTWIDVYQAAQGRAIEAESASDTAEVDEQLNELKGKVEEKRQALDRFRKEYDIVTLERNENRSLKKLTGLTESLNKANEDKVAAQARLGAIRAAIAQGRPVVVNSHGQDSLASLEQRLVEIKEELKELENEFTPRYMSVDPKIKGLVRRRDLLQEEIRSKRREGRQTALAQAEHDVASARQVVASLRRQLDAHRQQVMEFTTRFAEHEALQEELLQLETVYREVQDRQLQIQVNARSQYPQVSVRERAYLPERPAYPDYMRDAGISVAISLLAGLLVLWLYDFLTRPARHPAGGDIKQVFVTSPQGRIPDQMPDVPRLQPVDVPALGHSLPTELSQAEIMELLRCAGPDVRLLIVCLLSGLTAEEASGLQWGDIDHEAGVIRVKGQGDRTIPLAPPVRRAIEAAVPALADSGLPVWQDAAGEPLARDDMAAMLLYTAHDAGLTRPPDVTPEAVRHTYIGYLVRKGVRLNDLSGLVGHMPPGMLAAYGIYSPPGSAVPLESVASVYPALERFYQLPPEPASTPDPDSPA